MFQTRSRAGTERLHPAGRSRHGAGGHLCVGKVLYEISTGKDRKRLRSCRRIGPVGGRTRPDPVQQAHSKRPAGPNPRLRYRDAEEMMSALLAFQFCRRGPFEGKIPQSSFRKFSLIGP